MRILSALAGMLLASSAMAADVVYVSVAAEKRIAVYQIDTATGNLTHVDDCSTSGEPGALTTDPKRNFLFAAIRSTGELAAFRIDPKTGKLTHISAVAGGEDPAHITVDKTGTFLLTAYYVAGQVTVHEISHDGLLTRKPKQTIKTDDKAHAVVFDPNEWALLVPHTGPDVIHALPWSGKTGEIEQGIFKNEFKTPAKTGPRHIVFHPTLELNLGVDCLTNIAYVVNEQGGSVSMYHAILNPINWQLRSEQTLSTLPADFKGTNACAEIRIHPTNRFLYVSNRGHDSVAAFSINKETGKLTSLGQTPTEKTPRSFDIDPSGKYLFAAGESSGRLAAYCINEDAGTLKLVKTYDVGKTPWWVMAVRLPEK